MLPAWDHLTSEIILPHQITTKGSSFALGPYSTIQGQKSTRNVHSFLTDWFRYLTAEGRQWEDYIYSCLPHPLELASTSATS
eukprot:scaffold112675_cov19-Tisochrysis_lutea.AAC.3